MMMRPLRVGDVFRLLPRPNGAKPTDVEHRLAMTWRVVMVRAAGLVAATNTDRFDRTQVIEFHQDNDWRGWTPEYVDLLSEVES